MSNQRQAKIIADVVNCLFANFNETSLEDDEYLEVHFIAKNKQGGLRVIGAWSEKKESCK